MYKGRRIKKLWGHKVTSPPTREDSDNALAEGFSPLSTPEPNYLEGAPCQSSASDDDEIPHLNSRRSSYSGPTNDIASNNTHGTGFDTPQTDNHTRALNLDPTNDPDFEVTIPQTRSSTDMSDGLGGYRHYIRNTGHVQFSEDVADRNAEMNKRSSFPNPSLPDFTQRFNEEIADRNINGAQGIHPESTPIIRREGSRSASISPYALVEPHDRKFSQSHSKKVSDDVYRRVGRKPTGYVSPDGFGDMDTTAARRMSPELTGGSLQQEVGSNDAKSDDFDEMDSEHTRRRSLMIAGRPLRADEPPVAVDESNSEFLIANTTASSTSRESQSPLFTTPASQSNHASDESEDSSTGRPRPMLADMKTSDAVVENAKLTLCRDRKIGLITTSEYLEQRMKDVPRALPPYMEDSNIPEQGVDARLANDTESKIPSSDLEQSIDGGPRKLLPFAEPEETKKSFRKSLKKRLGFRGHRVQPENASESSMESVEKGIKVLQPYNEPQDTDSSEDSMSSRHTNHGLDYDNTKRAESSRGSEEDKNGNRRAFLSYAEQTIREPASVKKSNQASSSSSSSSSQPSQAINPGISPTRTSEKVDNGLRKDRINPTDMTSVVDLHNTTNTTVDIDYAPAVIHETVFPQTHHIREEEITQEHHNHDVYHRILPIHDVKVLRPRHFIYNPDGDLVEVPESTIPDSRKAVYPLSRASTKPTIVPDGAAPPVERWCRPFSARYWKGTEGDTKDVVGEDGSHQTERTWVHPPTLEEGGKLTGQTTPFYFDDSSEKIHDMDGLVKTSVRMPGGWDGASDMPIQCASVVDPLSSAGKVGETV